METYRGEFLDRNLKHTKHVNKGIKADESTYTLVFKRNSRNFPQGLPEKKCAGAKEFHG